MKIHHLKLLKKPIAILDDILCWKKCFLKRHWTSKSCFGISCSVQKKTGSVTQQKIIPHRTDECLCEKHTNELGGRRGERAGTLGRRTSSSQLGENTGKTEVTLASLALNERN